MGARFANNDDLESAATPDLSFASEYLMLTSANSRRKMILPFIFQFQRLIWLSPRSSTTN